MQMENFMRIPAILIASTLSTFTGCVGDAPNAQGTNGEDIIGGTTDYGDPAVVMIRSVTSMDASTGEVTGFAGCSGTLIAPTVLLTAAHCFEPTALWTDILQGTSFADYFQAATAYTNYATIIQHPFYDGNGADGHDVAVVLLTYPLAATPARRGATPSVGDLVRSVGYGNSNFDQTGFGTKRQITYPVTAVSPLVISAGSEGHDICHGDSGGPTFNAAGRIVGVNDFVDTPDCHGGAHMDRVDTNVDFIHWYVPSF
jgi:secreted trypsin-like serine protease